MTKFDTMTDQEVMRVLWSVLPRCAWHRDEEGKFVWDEPLIEMPTDAQIDAMIERLNKPHMHPRNRSYLPKDVQMDAIFKGFKYLRDHGTDIGPDADEWVDHCISVKAQFPKEAE